jgi:hypothetical protein
MRQNMSWYQAIRMAVELCRRKLLQWDSEAVHLDDWSSYHSRPHFDVSIIKMAFSLPLILHIYLPDYLITRIRQSFYRMRGQCVKILVDIRQLGWQWRYGGRNFCSKIVKKCILATGFLFSSALILTSQHNQNGVLSVSHPPLIHHVYLLDYSITRISHCHFTEWEDNALIWVDIRQLGWQWRYAGFNSCTKIVKRCIFGDWISFQFRPHFNVTA